ncbi:MAG: amidohydrolase [Paenisporosarcina sp.]
MRKLLHNATFYTMKSPTDTVEAVLIEDGKIITAGSFEDLESEATEHINLNGVYVYPGFVDSHIHLIGHGDKLRHIDLSKFSSAETMSLELKKIVRERKSEDWFVAEGWNENNFPDKKILQRTELDEITNKPLVLKRICRHAMIVNSKALEIAGITKDTPNPVDGVIVRDELGEPTGQLLDGAQNLIVKHIPEISVQQLVISLEIAINDLLKLGFTGVHTEDMSYYGEYTKPLEAFKKVIGDKRKFRVYLLRHHLVFEKMIQHATYNEPWIEPGAMKIFIDGALGGRTALLSEPYSDDGTTQGLAIHSQQELNDLVAKAREFGEAVAVHAIGDLGMEMIVEAIEKHPVPKGKRDRLIHANVLRDDLVERMGKLNIVLDIQPSFVTSDFPWVIERLGNERLQWAYAWKKLLDKGFICSGGSDSPIENVDPRLGLYAAVARKNPGEIHNGYIPGEKLTRYEAVALYTIGSAYAIGKEKQRGLIETNFDADFTIFDRNLFEGPDEQLLEAEVVKTIIAGEIIFEK